MEPPNHGGGLSAADYAVRSSVKWMLAAVSVDSIVKRYDAKALPGASGWQVLNRHVAAAVHVVGGHHAVVMGAVEHKLAVIGRHNREALPCPRALEIRRTAGISASRRCTPHLNEAVVGSVVEGDLTIAGVHHGKALPDPIGRQVVEVPHLTPLQFSPIHRPQSAFSNVGGVQRPRRRARAFGSGPIKSLPMALLPSHGGFDQCFRQGESPRRERANTQLLAKCRAEVDAIAPEDAVT